MNKNIVAKCPHCKTKFKYYESEFRPFCCEKCKMIDLGHWFQENYSIASNTPLSEEDIDKVEKELVGDEDF